MGKKWIAILAVLMFLIEVFSSAPGQALIGVTAPSFTVTRGTAGSSFNLSIPATAGSSTFTVKVYSSSDTYTAAILTRTGYVSGTDLYDGTDPITCSGATPLCYAIGRYRTFKFTITPEPGSGYSSNGESAKTSPFGMLTSDVITGFSALDSGQTVGITLTPRIGASANPQGGNVTIRAYKSTSSYLSVSDSSTYLNDGANKNIEIGSADGIADYKFDWRAEGLSANGVTWFTSDWSTKTLATTLVYLKPNAPTNLTTTVIDSKTVQLNWTAAVGGTQNYYIFTSPDGVSIGLYKGNTSGNQLVVSGLTPGTPIFFIIRNFGSGAYSRNSENAQTSSSVTPASLPGIASNLSITGGASPNPTNSISVRWSAPSTNGGSAITGYRIYYSTDNIGWSDSVTVSAGETSTVLTGLTLGFTYYIKVAAKNIQGYGSPTQPMSLLLVGNPVTYIHSVNSIGTSSVDITMVTDSQGQTTTPSFQYELSGSGAWTTVTLSSFSGGSRVDTTTVSGLIPGRSYTFMSNTIPGYSNDAGGSIRVTTTPTAITDITFTRKITSITASIAPFTTGSLYIIYYNIWAEIGGISVGQSCMGTTILVNGRINCEIFDLNPNTTYNVKANSYIQQGQYGNGTSVTTSTLVATDSGITSVSLALAGSLTSTSYRTATQIIATVSHPGKVTFYANGKYLPGCKSLTATSNVTCIWKPAQHGSVILTAKLKPTDFTYSSATSSMLNIGIGKRIGSR